LKDKISLIPLNFLSQTVKKKSRINLQGDSSQTKLTENNIVFEDGEVLDKVSSQGNSTI